MNTFEKIVEVLKEENEYSPKKFDMKGEPGSRTLEWVANDVDINELHFDNMLVQLLDDTIPVAPNPLLVETPSEDDIDTKTWNNHKIMIGNTQLPEQDCWAILVDCWAMGDLNEAEEATFTLFEGRSQVNTYLYKYHDEAMKDTVSTILSLMSDATLGDPVKMIRLRELLIEGGGGGIFNVWDSVASAKTLDCDTQPARKSSARARI